jgi:hypothetical protein
MFVATFSPWTCFDFGIFQPDEQSVYQRKFNLYFYPCFEKNGVALARLAIVGV